MPREHLRPTSISVGERIESVVKFGLADGTVAHAINKMCCLMKGIQMETKMTWVALLLFTVMISPALAAVISAQDAAQHTLVK
jgi:hypothetical protein